MAARQPAPGTADRATVLAWIDAEPGRGYRTAAAMFGLPVQRVKNWTARRTPVNPSEPHANPSGGAKMALVGGKREAPAQTVPKLARGVVNLDACAPEMREHLRGMAWGLAAFGDLVREAMIERRAASAERARLRATGMNMDEVDKCVPLPSLPDMRQVDAGARALKTTLEISPALASEVAGHARDGLNAGELADLDDKVLTPGPVVLRIAK